jgi:hypothetical protein
MGEEKYIFVGLEWEKDIRILEDAHVSFNPSPKHDIGVANRNNDDYKLTPFLQSTKAWKWRVQK